MNKKIAKTIEDYEREIDDCAVTIWAKLKANAETFLNTDDFMNPQELKTANKEDLELAIQRIGTAREKFSQDFKGLFKKPNYQSEQSFSFYLTRISSDRPCNRRTKRLSELKRVQADPLKDNRN